MSEDQIDRVQALADALYAVHVAAGQAVRPLLDGMLAAFTACPPPADEGTPERATIRTPTMPPLTTTEWINGADGTNAVGVSASPGEDEDEDAPQHVWIILNFREWGDSRETLVSGVYSSWGRAQQAKMALYAAADAERGDPDDAPVHEDLITVQTCQDQYVIVCMPLDRDRV